jgi:hypothetical protein
MGARRYDQSTQRFLQLDQYQGALADLSLASDPLTQNRYNLGASNPLSGIEWDGHMVTQASAGGGCSPNPSCATTGSTSTTNAGGPGTSGCPWSVFKLGACASERGAVGTTPEQVKQSFIYASQILATAVPLGGVFRLGGLAVKAVPKLADLAGPALKLGSKLGDVLTSAAGRAGSGLLNGIRNTLTRTAPEDAVDLYHGTNSSGAENILKNGVDPSYAPRSRDFGNGFYTSQGRSLAENWAAKVAGWRGGDPVVLHFRVPASALDSLNSLSFEGDSPALRDFLMSMRTGGSHSYCMRWSQGRC